MKINRPGSDSQIVSSASETTPKQEAQKATGDSNLQSRWDQFVSESASHGGAVDPNALVQHVLRESYVQNTEDLHFYSEKVKYFNTCKKVVRDYVSNLRDFDMKLKGDVDSMKPGKKIDPNVITEASKRYGVKKKDDD